MRCRRSYRQVAELGYYTFNQMRVHGDTLYWTESGKLSRQNGATTEVLITSPRVEWFALDDDAVYFVNTDFNAGQRNILRAKLDGSEITTVASNIAIGRFVLDEDRIYFDTASGQFVTTTKLGGGAVEPVVGPATAAQIMDGGDGGLIDATHLYWNEQSGPDFTLKRVAKGTANVETVATNLPGRAILLQGDGVLLLAGSRDLLEVPKAGGCAQFLGNASSDITADDHDIYWYGLGVDTSVALYRLPRRGGMEIEAFSSRAVGSARSIVRLTPTQAFYSYDAGDTTFRVVAIDRR